MSIITRKRKKEDKKIDKRSDGFPIIMTAIILVAVLITVVNFEVLRTNVNKAYTSNENLQHSYKYHFALVYDGSDNEMWNTVYECANEYAMANDAYVEVIGENLPETYTKSDLMEIAMLSDVDGIIVEGDDSNELTTAIDEAEDADIPVVTVITDSDNSKRNSFVGISSYDVGLEFGQQLIDVVESEKLDNNGNGNIMVLMSSGNAYSAQHTMYLAIMEKLARISGVNVEVQLLKDDTAFSTDEAIRDILINLQEEPDIMMCLSEEITESAYQAVVEYNKVGRIDVVGYASTKAIYNAINKNLIKSVISLDEKKMGINCVEALIEYINMGYVSEYMMVATTLVTKDNVREYIDEDGK